MAARSRQRRRAIVVEPLRTMALQATGLVDVPVEIRRHPSARRLTLRIHQARRAVIVTVPTTCGLSEAARFVATHADWVRTRLHALPDAIKLTDGALVPIRGVVCRLKFAGATATRGAVVTIDRSQMPHPHLIVRGDIEHAGRRLKDWLYEEARRELDHRVRFHATRLGLKPKRLSIRDQGSRWGSCSSTGALSFSWRLILAPPEVLDYVAAHEVAHLGEMNHGPRFWALVRKTMPEMNVQRQWLRLHGLELHRYAPR